VRKIKTFDDYIKRFENLNVDKNRNRYSKGKAPHKAILLLSVILLHEKDKIDLNNIEINKDLLKMWVKIWDCLEYDKQGPIYLPAYHLKSDGFWNIEFKNDLLNAKQPTSIKKLKEIVNRIYLDEKLIRLINDKNKSKKLIQTLLNCDYFSELEKNNLTNTILKSHRVIKNNRNGKVEKMEETYNLSPKKDIYKVAAQDVDPYIAIKELVDNAIDNWRRLSEMEKPLRIVIKHKEGKLMINDNSGGLKEEEIPMLFTLGMSTEKEIKGSIGAFGIGAKKAIVRLGKKAVLKSRYKNSKKGYGFSITESWLNGENWDVNKLNFPNMKSGTTSILIKNLNISWTKNFEDNLKKELSKTYDLILRKHPNLDIIINGDKISHSDPIDWSFTKFDGLYPRKFKNIVLKNKEIPNPIILNITVGLIRVGDQINSGVDFYCQNRKVLENVKDKRAGFYAKNKGGLGLFHSNHDNRLKVIVELITDYDASHLPWNSQKSEIKFHHPVTKELHRWMKQVVSPYFDLKTGDIREKAVKPFHKNSKHAANNGEIVEFDYSNEKSRAKVKDIPNDGLKQINEVISSAKCSFLDYYLDGKINTSNIEEWQKPLYKRELELLENNFKANKIDKRAKEDLLNYIRNGEKNKRGLDEHEFDYYKYKLEDYSNKVDYEGKIKGKARNHLKDYLEDGETNPVNLKDIEKFVYEKELQRLEKEYKKGNILVNINTTKSNNKTQINVELGGNIKPSKDIPVPIPRDKLDNLCNKLGIPPNSTTEEIGKKLASEVIDNIL